MESRRVGEISEQVNPLTIPRQALEDLARLKDIRTTPDQWTYESLSSNGRIFRIETGQGSWIVKDAKYHRKEIAVSRVYLGYSIPTFEVERLCDSWLVYQDLRLPTLENYLRKHPDGDTAEIFFHLGVVSMQAELIGMGDRNLRNVLIDKGALKLYLVDYESAFSLRIFDRIFRPQRYYTYLMRRMFLDVLSELPALRRGGNEVLISRFRKGMMHEQERINNIGTKAYSANSRLTWSEKLLINTRVSAPGRLLALIDQGYTNALRREKRRMVSNAP